MFEGHQSSRVKMGRKPDGVREADLLLQLIDGRVWEFGNNKTPVTVISRSSPHADTNVPTS